MGSGYLAIGIRRDVLDRSHSTVSPSERLESSVPDHSAAPTARVREKDKHRLSRMLATSWAKAEERSAMACYGL